MSNMTPKQRKMHDLLVYWVHERESIRVAKEAGKPRPWTTDHILDTYRFCNVRREDDRVTRWIAANWREPNKADRFLWFAMVVARLFNQPSTLEALGYPGVYSADNFRRVINNIQGRVFNAAYIVSTNRVAMNKVDYLLERVLQPVWDARNECDPKGFETLAGYCRQLTKFDGIGSFIGAQVIADLKYVQLREARDWSTFAASGPGSRRGMNRLLRREVKAPWKEHNWHEELLRARQFVNSKTGFDLHGQDVQNCLCEFDKYVRVKTGEGKPKQKYAYSKEISK